MNESITRAAGGRNGQEMSPEAMERAIHGVGRTPVQRTTSYGQPREERTRVSFSAAPLVELQVAAHDRESGNAQAGIQGVR